MPSPPVTPVPDKPKDIFAVFCGVIDHQAVQKLFNTLTLATVPTNNVRTVHMIFNSAGGNVADGVCLYNFFKAMTVDLALYNVGAVWSAAAIAYLGAKKRRTGARASFMIHRTHVSPQAAKAGALKAYTNSVALDDARTESILREHLKLSNWEDLDKYDLFFSGQEAVEIGLADEVAEFCPPPGTQIFNV
jgi:ATP-dependent Clp protease protease subunit